MADQRADLGGHQGTLRKPSHLNGSPRAIGMPPNDACSQPLRRCGGTGTERANRGWPSMSIRKPALLPPRGLKKKPARESSNVNRTIDTKGRLKHGILGCSLPLPHAISPNRQIGKSAGVKAVGFGRFRSRLCQRGSRLETAGRTRPAHAGGGGGGGSVLTIGQGHGGDPRS